MRGTRFQEKSFSVPASAGTKDTCAKDGHTWADRKGKCVRCGEKIRDQWGDIIPEGTK